MSTTSGIGSQTNLLQLLQLASAQSRQTAASPAAPGNPSSTPRVDADRPRAGGPSQRATPATPDHDGDADDKPGRVDRYA